MNETVISWTPQNWVTVLLMVLLGSVILGAVAASISSIRRKASGE